MTRWRRKFVLPAAAVAGLCLAAATVRSSGGAFGQIAGGRVTKMIYTGDVAVEDEDGEEGGLTFRIGDAQGEGEPGEAPVKIARPRAEQLDAAAAARILARLPALPEVPGEKQPFALREKSLPPPRTGKTVHVPFPPPSSPLPFPSAATTGPLDVVRFAPEGEVKIAADLSVTFSQPMVAVTTQDELNQQNVPVRITPQPRGRWRWVGTKTLLFDPEVRFPMATRYSVEVPAGTTSAGGGTLAVAKRWTFTTPPPTVIGRHPQGVTTGREPLILAVFDQRIEAAALLPSIALAPAAGAAIAPRLATAEEIAADKEFKALWDAAPEDRRIALRPAQSLPSANAVAVTIAAGARSAEGSQKTTASQSWSFATYGAMTVVSHECGYRNECHPLDPWSVQFSNRIDAKKFERKAVSVVPALPGMKVAVWGTNLNISGEAKANSRYTVTRRGGSRRSSGRSLEKPVTFTIAVGAARPNFFVPGNNFVVLDPNGPQRVAAFTTGYKTLRITAYAVSPADFPAFQKAAAAAMRNERGASWNVGRVAHQATVNVRGGLDELAETPIDLAPALRGKPGHLAVKVEPLPRRADRNREATWLWVQSTRIGLDAYVDAQELVAFASSLADGKPLAGARLSLLPTGASTDTGADGLGRLALGTAGAGMLVARSGDDVALLPRDASLWGGGEGWQRSAEGTAEHFFVFDDRGMYRPGEEVKLKGIVRGYGMGRGGDLGLVPNVRSVSWMLRDSQGNEVAKGERPVGALGGFELSLPLPATINLGTASVEFTTSSGGVHTHSFAVEEFRRPEFEVKVAPSGGPYLIGSAAHATVSASYYAGGALGEAEVRWDVSSSPASFAPPNWDGFTFGRFVPWWGSFGRPTRIPGRGLQKSRTFAAHTDASGRHMLRIDLDAVTPPQATLVTASASVMDVNRQAWSDSTSLLVHPAAVYVGLRSDRYFVQQGQPLDVDVIVPDLDGKAVTGRTVAVRAERLDWEQVEGEWREVASPAGNCEVTSASQPQRCTFRPKEGGSYRITAAVQDEQGRANESVLQLWVAGGKSVPRRDVSHEEVQLIPAKKEFRAGETAEILVIAPFAPAEGVVTLRRSGIVKTERISLSGSSQTLKVAIDEAMTPNVYVQVDLVGAAPRTGDGGSVAGKRPAYASGSLKLEVPPRARTLAVSARPREQAIAPGESTTVDLEVKDAAGKPAAGSEVTVIVVDEAVLALSGYRTPDPLAAFYSEREPGVADYHSRAHVQLGKLEFPTGAFGGMADSVGVAERRANAPVPQAMAMMKSEAREDRTAGPAQAIRVRSDFAALAYFAPAVATDASGRASVTVKLPDNLTRYRVMAVAASGPKAFGSGESTLTARLPLMVRPSAPRFLNWGDRFELPVVVQNHTDEALDVEVAVRASNLAVVEGAGRRLRVPAHDRAEVRFAIATIGAGSARIQVAGVSGAYADSAEVSLPIWSPLTTEAFATYGQVDGEGAVGGDAVRQPIAAPQGVVPQFGGLEITTSSTALQALTDAVLYLVSYRFDCVEQVASRLLAIAALRDVLTAFEAKDLPKPEALLASVAADLKRLEALQNDDGGFAFWRRGDPSWPYLSIHAARALQAAKDKGFAVPAPLLERSRGYLRQVEKRIPKDYPPSVRNVLIAYALDVRARMGDPDPARARTLVQEAGVDKLSFESLGWLLGALGSDKNSAATVAAIRRRLDNAATETASTAHFAVSYSDGAHLLLHSDRRADAVILDALIAQDSRNSLIPKLVAGLLNHRKAGRWSNTQENAFVLLALDRYFGAYEKTTPDFVARLWLGEAFAGEQPFRGHSTESRRLAVPMAELVAGDRQKDLVIGKAGAGRLYYRIGLRYAPQGLRLDPADNGFVVAREYQGIDAPDDVRRKADGTWQVRAGARVRVRVTMVNEARRYHVALVDPLPAGFEAQNPALATTGPLPAPDQAGGSGDVRPLLRGFWWWPGPWFEHQNLRDDRVEAFTPLLWEGVHTYTYTARATTPGTFIVPPPTAEEMYEPETFGRGSSSTVVIQ